MNELTTTHINDIVNQLDTKLAKTIKNYHILKLSFGKSNSQWMESNMAMSAQTPLRNIRHLLARIERSHQACKETEYKLKKLHIQKRIKERDITKENDNLKQEIITIEIKEIVHKINSSMYYFQGAVNKIQHNYDCIQQIMNANNYSSFDEIDFEKEEEEYHIKTAINQSIRSIRTTGTIDPGNQEYLEQCGINPGIAQANIIGYLILENKKLHDNNYDKTTKSLYDFIEQCYQKFKGLSKERLQGLGVKNGFMEDVMFKLNNNQKKLLSTKPTPAE